ncbi:glycosyltransferase family 1 protein [Pantoea sp. CFSAN033090]|uniref:glycosyltransferase family 4 protein n=1 Tax=Pantoea sp. CFSAN033090 TaxID=1690502 RepID=UPI00069212C8|nr:glycosyltransferase family 1 protein [Pantoea sp. CFSAN033090]KOA72591.1 mannosyltransferase [Pantoea sp. CFSAN033090]
MKIIISTDSIKFPVTGIGRYALELINNLKANPEIDAIKYLSGFKVVDDLPALVNSPSISASKLKKQLRNSRLVSDIYRLTVPALKSYALKSYTDYIFHSPNYYIPPGHKKSCATFHDLSIFHFPEYHPKGRVHLMKKELHSSVSRAKFLITDSNFTKNEVSDFFNFDPERIVVAPLASSGDFLPRKENQCQQVLERYDLAYGQFTFFAGTIEPRKNIKNLLLAYQKLPLEMSLRFPLVISGYQGWESEELHRLFDIGSQRGWIKYLGYTDQQSLSVLFSACRAFLFPSRYEGFGLPVLEAMAAGTPVITSNVSSLPEVAGDAGLMVDPDDVDQLAQYISDIILNDSLRAELIDRGFLQNAKFSWVNCARETIKAYKLVNLQE